MPTRCRTCQGVYMRLLPDGTTYFHRCPPVDRVRAQVAGGAIVLFDSRLTVTTVTNPDGSVTVTRTFLPPLPAGAVFLEQVFIDRPNFRDENVPSTRAEDSGRVKAPGAGTDDLP